MAIEREEMGLIELNGSDDEDNEDGEASTAE